ncbi:uncharacterized protein [Antedon mediterranea]|uniref:uncharacterized protein n=1 Tax=Antedon mediterranea TaxID=105859 RepID=UPI003AF7729F
MADEEDQSTVEDRNNSMFWVWILCCLGCVFIVIVTALRCLRMQEQDVDAVPYSCLYIDSTYSDFIEVLRSYFKKPKQASNRKQLISSINKVWSPDENKNPVLVSLSFKTALDLFLRIQKYPPASEIILTAINIPDVVQILSHHGIKVVPIDIHKETMAPNIEHLDQLLTEKTVALIATHLFGRSFDMSAVIERAKSHGIHVLEDRSQSFNGLQDVGDPESDLTFFSFDVTQQNTTFGGAVIKVKDRLLYNKMLKLYDSYPLQKEHTYVADVFKFSVISVVLNNPVLTNFGTTLFRFFKRDMRKLFNQLLTAPSTSGLIRGLRFQPSNTLLYMMEKQFTCFDEDMFKRGRESGEYVSDRLPQVAEKIGMMAKHKGYWLFPIIVEDAEEVTKRLNNLGIDASREVAHLQLIKNDDVETSADDSLDVSKYILEYVVYLPVHKRVRIFYLDQILLAVEIVLNKLAILKRFDKGYDKGHVVNIDEIAEDDIKNQEPSVSGGGRRVNGNKRKTVTFSPMVTVRRSHRMNDQ